jgi:hypothetical protein
MLSVVMLNVVMLSIVMLNVVILSVVVPSLKSYLVSCHFLTPSSFNQCFEASQPKLI